MTPEQIRELGARLAMRGTVPPPKESGVLPTMRRMTDLDFRALQDALGRDPAPWEIKLFVQGFEGG